MKKLIFLLYVLVSTLCIGQSNYGLELEWANTFGSSPIDRATDMTIDKTGNVYLTGNFYPGTVDFDPGPDSVNLTNVSGERDAYIAKYDSSGNLIFAHSFGNSGTWEIQEGRSIAVDTNGNVLATGIFMGTVDFDPSSSTAILSSQAPAIYMAKYDAMGNYIFANKIESSFSLDVRSIAVDKRNNFYITGKMEGSNVDFDPGPGSAILSTSSSDMFFAKYDSMGNHVYSKKTTSTTMLANNVNSFAIEVDQNENVYVAGAFRNTVDFDPGSGTAFINGHTGGGFSSFIAKYDSLGNYIYAKALGGPDQGINSATSLAVDNDENVYVTGGFRTTVDFDPGLDSIPLTSAGKEDIYIAKYDAMGNYVFAKSIGGTDEDKGKSIALDTDGNIFISGYFDFLADFDPGPDVANLNGLGRNIFIAKYDELGNYIYAKDFEQGSSQDNNKIKVNSNGDIYFKGNFSDTIYFNTFLDTVYGVSNGSIDFFIAKYNEILLPSIWSGSDGTAWEELNNWINGKPDFESEVIIPGNPDGGNFPEVSTDIEVNSLKIESDAQLIINPGNSITVTDTLINNGTISSTPGSFIEIDDSGVDIVITSVLCPEGSYCPNGVDVIPCTSGTSQPLAGQSECIACEPGTFSSIEGQVECTECPEGTEQPLSGQDGCVALTSISSLENGAVKLYPNPAQNEIVLVLENNHKFENIELVSITGKVLNRQQILNGNTIIKIDLNTFSAGVYLVKVNGLEYQTVKKLIKQ